MGQAAIWIKYINAWFPNFLLSSFHLFRPCLGPQSCLPSCPHPWSKMSWYNPNQFNHGFHGYDLD